MFKFLMHIVVACGFCIIGIIFAWYTIKSISLKTGGILQLMGDFSASIIFACLGFFMFKNAISSMPEQTVSNANNYSIYVSVNSNDIDYSSYEVVRIDDENREILLKPAK